MEKIKDEIASLEDELIALRRDFHKYPELGYQEFRTSGMIAEYLSSLGLEVTRLEKTGVVGLLKGEGEQVKPCCFVRIWMPSPSKSRRI